MSHGHRPSRLRGWIFALSVAACCVRGEAFAQQTAPVPPPATEAAAPTPVVATARTEFSAYTDTDTVTVFTPAAAAAVTDPTRGWSASGRYLADIVSAASVDIVSTASRRWSEVRHAAGVGAGYKPDTVGVRLDAGFSTEPDYRSLNAGGRLLLDLADKTANPVLGYTFGHDTAGRTGTPFSVYSQELQRHSFDAGIELILGRGTVAFLGVNAILERGDQKKPYRFLPVFAPGVAPGIPAGASLALVNQARLPGRMAERTPDARNRFAVSARLARRFSRSTLLVSERLYADDWGLFATTSDAQYIQEVGKRFLAWVHLRGHLQSGVSFWERAYTAEPGTGDTFSAPVYRTGDRELSPFFAGTVGAGARWNFGSAARPTAWGLALQADVVATNYFDALYLESRLAQISILQLEVEL